MSKSSRTNRRAAQSKTPGGSSPRPATGSSSAPSTRPAQTAKTAPTASSAPPRAAKASTPSGASAAAAPAKSATSARPATAAPAGSGSGSVRLTPSRRKGQARPPWWQRPPVLGGAAAALVLLVVLGIAITHAQHAGAPAASASRAPTATVKAAAPGATTAARPTATPRPQPTVTPTPLKTPTPVASNTPCGSTIKMDDTSFSVVSCTIKRGASLTFANVSASETHIICGGRLQSCQPTAGIPDGMNFPKAITLQPGEKSTVVFTQDGVYSITCLVHDGMDMSIRVAG